MNELDINISDSDDRLEALDGAVDLAADQDQRTVITAGGKRIAAVVTAEDLIRLETLDAERDARVEKFWHGALTRARHGETIWFTGALGGEPYAGLAPTGRIMQGAPGVPGITRTVPDDGETDASTDAITRTASMLWTLWQLTDAAPSWRSPEAIEEYLRHGR